MSSYWEETAYGAPPLAALERSDASVVFGWLEGNLAILGSKIDWSVVRGRHVHWRTGDDRQVVALVVREIGLRVRHGVLVEHVGDGLSPFGLEVAQSFIERALEASRWGSSFLQTDPLA